MAMIATGTATGGRLAGVLHRCGRLVAAGTVAVTLTACYDTEYQLSIKPDGKAAVDIAIKSEKDMADVFAMIEAFADVAPEAAALKGGACNAVAELGKTNPMAAPYNLRGKQGVTGNQFFCNVGGDVGTIQSLAGLAGSDPTGAVTVKEAGPNRYQITIDLGALPAMDTSELIKMGMLMNGGSIAPGSPPMKPEVISAFADKYSAAMIAFNRIVMRGKNVDLVISAKKIVESNGKVSADGRSARFSMTADEFVGLMMKGDARRGKKFHAVVEY